MNSDFLYSFIANDGAVVIRERTPDIPNSFHPVELCADNEVKTFTDLINTAYEDIVQWRKRYQLVLLDVDLSNNLLSGCSTSTRPHNLNTLQSRRLLFFLPFCSKNHQQRAKTRSTKTSQYSPGSLG